MWTLGQARTNLRARLAETSPVFWETAEPDGALNEAQRFIAALTKGVPSTVTGDVDTSTPYLAVTGKLLGEHAAGAKISGGSSLSWVPIEAANKGFPTWPTFTGTPRWAIIAPHEDRVYFAPAPLAATTVVAYVSVLPSDLSADGDQLFDGIKVMEKYQGAALNVAASLMLLKERYDGDAERFYQFGVQELQSLGLDPARIPPLQEVARG